jgi:hypothetical protein
MIVAIEAEVMPAATLRLLLREAIEAFLRPQALAITRAAEKSEPSLLKLWADGGAS